MKSKKLLLTFLLFWFFAAGAWSSIREVPVDELKPSTDQQKTTRNILWVIGKHHYKKQALDDAMSAEILRRYLEALDPNKSYFTQPDVDRFMVFRDHLDDALRKAKLDPAFEIFKLYRQRVEERVAYALEQLRQPHDFTVDETYLFDRGEAPWVADAKALDELWRKKVKNDILALRLKKKEQEEIATTLQKRYEGLQRRTRQLDSGDVFQTFINSYTLSLEPHTAYMSPRVSENFDINMRLSLEGIGAVLSLDNEYTVVQRTVKGGPARQSGKIHKGDRIIAVGQGKDGELVDVVGLRLQDVVEQIRGPKGTVVRLLVMPEKEGVTGDSFEVTLVRNTIKLEDQAAKSSIIEGIDNLGPLRIGVIDLPAFYRDFKGQSRGDKDFRSTTRDVRKLLGELTAKGVDGILIDLRGNGGGSLVEATELTGLFISTGPVVQVKHGDGELEVEKDQDPEIAYEGPLAVLVDRNSASASEIFAGAIQDYRRGIIIGEPTFGKGTVQTLVNLSRTDEDYGRLRLTMAQFFRVEGGSTQFLGVVPDIVYPSAVTTDEEGERSLENALPWAQIKAVDYEPQVLGSIERYRTLHRERIAKDPGFIYLAEEAKLLKEVRDQDRISLQESVREAEWSERKSRQLAEKNRFRKAIGLEPEKDDEDADEEPVAEEDEEENPYAKIMLNEAARVLADYISGQTRAAMVE